MHEDQGAAVQGRVSGSAGGEGLPWVTICGKPCVVVWVAGEGRVFRASGESPRRMG